MKCLFRKSQKYILSLIVILICISQLCVVHANAKTNCDVKHLMEMFPDGKYWNHVGFYENNPDGWTDTPCPHVLVDSGLGYDYYVGLGSCNEFGGDVQCVGFVNRLVYEAYGMENYLSWEQKYTLDDVKAGDVIRFLYDMHTILVTSVDGDTITYGECNGDLSDCKIKWNVQKTKDEIYESFTVLYSAPAPLSVPFANRSVISSGKIELGDTVTLTAVGEGGEENYQYKIALLTPKDTTYVVVQEYSDNAVFSYTPEELGDYKIKVTVQDTSKEVSTRYFDFTVKKPAVDYNAVITLLQAPTFLLAVFVISRKSIFNLIS